MLSTRSVDRRVHVVLCYWWIMAVMEQLDCAENLCNHLEKHEILETLLLPYWECHLSKLITTFIFSEPVIHLTLIVEQTANITVPKTGHIS